MGGMGFHTIRLKACLTDGDYPRSGAALISLNDEAESINIAVDRHV